MKTRDAVAVAALRSALAAIENAEAADPGQAAARTTAPAATHADVAGSVGGLWATEVERRVLTEARTEEIVRGEVDERLAAADGYERSGHREHAERLRREAAVLRAHLPG